MNTPDIFSKLPSELIPVFLRCVLLQSGHIVLFSFLNAFPRYSELVFIAILPYETLENLGVDATVFQGLDGLRMVWCKTKLTCLSMPFRNPDASLLRGGEFIQVLQESGNLLRIFLLPDCEFSTFEWSERTFPYSILAQAIQNCDCVVAGASKSQSHHRGIELIRTWCTLVKTPMTVYFSRRPTIRGIIGGLINHYFGYLHYDSPYKRVVKEFVNCRVDVTRQPRLTYTDVASVTLIGYDNFFIEGRFIHNYRFAFASHCRTSGLQQCSSPVVHQTRIRRFRSGSIYLEFSSCRIPRMTSSLDLQQISPFGGGQLVLENIHWSPENPLGRDVCEHARDAGVHFQADYWEDLEPGSFPLLPFLFVTLIGVPEALVHVMNWEMTSELQLKRLESMNPERQPSGHAHVYFPDLERMDIEATSNDLYYGSFKADAPNLKWLKITMLSGSTRMWDLRSLLFYRPFKAKTQLDVLILEHNGAGITMGLSSKEIQPVSGTLVVLCVKSLHPLFLINPGRDVVLNFLKLEYLQLDSSWHWPSKMSLDPSRFLRLKQLVLGSSYSTICYPLFQIELNPIPKSLGMIAMGKNFGLSYHIVVEGGQVLGASLTHRCLKDEWEIWKRSSDQSLFSYFGALRNVPSNVRSCDPHIFCDT